MRKRVWQIILTWCCLGLILLCSCNKPNQPPHNTSTPTQEINSFLGDSTETSFPSDPTATNTIKVKVQDPLTIDYPIITRENFSQLHQEFRIGEGSFQNEFALSPDGSSLAILSAGGIVFVDTNTWERSGFYALDGKPNSIVYSHDGNSIAVLFTKRIETYSSSALDTPYTSFLQIINPSNLESSLELMLSGNGCATFLARNVALSPDGQKIAYWGINSYFENGQKDNICVHSTLDGTLLSKIAVPTRSSDYTRPIFFSQDSAKVYAVGADQNNNWSIINVINTEDGSLQSVSGGIGNISDISYDVQNNLACFTGEEGTAILSLVDFSHKESSEISTLKGEKITCNSDDGSVFLSTESGYYLFGWEDYNLLWGPESKPNNLVMGREQTDSRTVEITNQIIFNPTSDQVYILHNNYGGNDDFLEVLDIQTGKEVHRIHGQNPIVRNGISPDNHLVAIGGYGNGQVQVWSVSEGECLIILRGHEKMVYQTVFSPDGNYLATASADTTVKLWDSQTGNLLLTFSGHQGPVWAIAFSKSGDKLYSAGDDQDILVWNTSSGTLESRIELTESTQQHRFLLLSPLGNTMFLASSCYSVNDCKVPWTTGDLLEIDLNTGQILRKVPFPTLELSLSTDGSMFSGEILMSPELVHFTGQPFESMDEIQVYKTSSGVGYLYGSTMSKDGSIFVGLNGKELLFWDVATQSLLGSLPSDSAGRMLFSEDQKSLWVMDMNLGIIVVWVINS